MSKWVWHFAYYMATVFVVFLSFLLFLTTKELFGYNAYWVESASMEPALSEGSLIVTTKGIYNTGDIITYSTDKQLITHRIIETDGQTFTTQGDQNTLADDPTNHEAIRGKVILSIPLLGYLVSLADNRFGFILLIFIPVFSIIIVEAMRIYKEIRGSYRVRVNNV